MTDRICDASECRKPRHRGRYCSMHAERLRRHGSLEKPTPFLRGKARPDFVPKYGSECLVEECGRPATHPRGMCTTHYRRWRESGVLGGAIEGRTLNRGRKCSVADCDQDARERGWCSAHYSRALRNGDPGTAPIKGSPDYPRGYAGVHDYLRAVRGRAADMECVDCGGPADEWSYDNADLDELCEPSPRGTPRYFSRDVTHYEPRCRSCHRRFDHSFDRDELLDEWVTARA